MAIYDSVRLNGTYYGDFGPIDRRPSQMNRYYERRIQQPYGRDLRGDVEPEEMQPTESAQDIADRYWKDSWGGDDPNLLQASQDDDSVGNGIFDGPGSPPVQHANAGVFQARYSEPGYLYRERMTRRGEIASGVDQQAMLFVPAGGGPGIDMAEAYRPFDEETVRHYNVQPRSLNGLGESEPISQSWLGWLVGGVAVGVAAAMLLKKK